MKLNIENSNQSNELVAISETMFLEKTIVVYGTVEEPLFLAKDVAEWIEYDPNDINKFMNMVDEEEKLTATIYRSGQNRQMWFLTEIGVIQSIRNTRKLSSKEKDTLIRKIFPQQTKNIYLAKVPELDFKDILFNFCRGLNISVEFQKRVSQYRVDFYLPEYNLIIEFDEKHHKFQRKEDKQRERKIKQAIHCDFVRLNHEDNNAYNLGKIVKNII